MGQKPLISTFGCIWFFITLTSMQGIFNPSSAEWLCLLPCSTQPNSTRPCPALQPDPRAQPDLVSSSARREVIREAGEEDHTHIDREGNKDRETHREMNSWRWVSRSQETTHPLIERCWCTLIASRLPRAPKEGGGPASHDCSSQ